MRLLFIILLFLSVGAAAQNNGSTAQKKIVKKEDIPDFKNTAEQEEYYVKKMFKEEYKKQSFNKFSGRIDAINKHTLKFDTLIFQVSYIPTELRLIFYSGILYPALFGGEDSLYITDFQEVKYLDNKPTYKRFTFWLFRPWLANPFVYYIELTNEKATKESSMTEFILGSKLTFFRDRGWIL